jgi:MoxR-like ATPase
MNPSNPPRFVERIGLGLREGRIGAAKRAIAVYTLVSSSSVPSDKGKHSMADQAKDAMSVPNLALETAVRRIAGVVQGKEEVVRLVMTGFLARGHVLLEDVPGVGKTTLGRAVSRVVGGVFRRIQLTADLLPADIIGGSVIDRKTGELTFRQGPIFANVVLADELNRATPRTQSGLLEAMAEHAVSVDGVRHPLPNPFFVLATQNPMEHHGVYALPQSQLDRFLLRLSLGYPDAATEKGLLMAQGSAPGSADLDHVEQALQPALLPELFKAVDAVHLSEPVVGYLQALIHETREGVGFRTGVSTRGALLFARCARAYALLSGRNFVTPDDLRQLAVPVCAHRVVIDDGATGSRERAEALVREIVDRVPPPL